MSDQTLRGVTFISWLKRRTKVGRGCPVRDLAVDFGRAVKMGRYPFHTEVVHPPNDNCLRSWESYLSSLGASGSAIAALREAHAKYEKQCPPLPARVS